MFGALAGLFLLLAAPAAAGPIDVIFRSNDGTAYAELSFNNRSAIYQGPLDSGRFEFDGRVIDSSLLWFEYYQIADSLQIIIRGDETSGLAAGDNLHFRFGNPDEGYLVFPTYGSLSTTFGGVDKGRLGIVTPVPEPLSAGLFGVAAGALVWRRRRRGLAGVPAANA
jgi:hypothetical protein